MSVHFTKERILKVLCKIEKNQDVELVSFTTRPGAEQGENFSGIIIACDIVAKVNKEDKEYDWMVKLPIDDPYRRLLNRAMRMEEKEVVVMYSEIIPQWKHLAKERKADIMPNFCQVRHAEFHRDIDLGSILVMDNLRSVGYVDAVDKKRGLNLEYTRLVLESLAKFHALGHAFMRSIPNKEEALERFLLLSGDFFTSEMPIDKSMSKAFKESTVSNMVDLLKLVEEPGQQFARDFKDFHEAKDAFALRDQLRQPNPNGFNIICHGDAWFGNMLFRHETRDDGTVHPTEVCLLDLALCHWASPCTDLTYFLFMSTPPQLRRTQLTELLGIYHDKDLVNDYERYSYYGFFMALWVLPSMICKKEDALTQEELGDNMKIREKTVKAVENEPYIKVVMVGNFLEVADTGLFKIKI